VGISAADGDPARRFWWCQHEIHTTSLARNFSKAWRLIGMNPFAHYLVVPMKLNLPSGDCASIPTCRYLFRRWEGKPIRDTYGGKSLIEFDKKPIFAELAILGTLCCFQPSPSPDLTQPGSTVRSLISRIGVGLLEAIALGLVPWLAVVGVMSIVNKSIPISQVTSYVVLLVAGGLVFFAMGVLVSSLVGGEYTAPALAFGIVLLVAIISDAWFREYSVWRLVTGDLSINRGTYLLPQHLPWLGILASICLALLMMAASVFSLQKRDF
jgi:hypothetical protein